MLTKPKTFEQLLSLWANPSELSSDLDLPYVSAQMIRRRGSISPAHWPAFVSAAKRKGVELTMDDMVQMKIERAQRVAA